MNRLRVFNIQFFSLHDGPGIRTTCFLKGCNLRCQWCHNPESYEKEKTLRYMDSRCLRCGACAAVCENGVHSFTEEGIHQIDRNSCAGCGRCLETCVSQALCLAGEDMDETKLLHKLLRDQKLFEISNGGVTFSGGEPLLQVEGIVPVAEKLREKGISIAVDTAANVSWHAFEQIIPVTDLFLFDLKQMDPVLHKKFTGVDNVRILENIKRAAALKPCCIRMPLIAGVNDQESHIRAAAIFLDGIREHVQKLELLTYHDLGISKAREIGRAQPVFESPSEEEMEMFVEIFREYGLKAEIS